MADDVYEGYFIPKDSLVIANVWYAVCSITYVELDTTNTAQEIFA